MGVEQKIQIDIFYRKKKHNSRNANLLVVGKIFEE